MTMGLWLLLHIHAKGKGRFLFWKESGVVLTLVMSQSFPGFRNLQDGKNLARSFSKDVIKNEKIIESVSCRIVGQYVAGSIFVWWN